MESCLDIEHVDQALLAFYEVDTFEENLSNELGINVPDVSQFEHFTNVKSVENFVDAIIAGECVAYKR